MATSFQTSAVPTPKCLDRLVFLFTHLSPPLPIPPNQPHLFFFTVRVCADKMSKNITSSMLESLHTRLSNATVLISVFVDRELSLMNSLPTELVGSSVQTTVRLLPGSAFNL